MFRTTIAFVAMVALACPADAGLFRKKAGCSASTATAAPAASCSATTTKTKTKTKSVLQWAGSAAVRPFKGKACANGACVVN